MAVLNNETRLYASAEVISVYNGPRLAKVRVDEDREQALLPWKELKAATRVGSR